QSTDSSAPNRKLVSSQDTRTLRRGGTRYFDLGRHAISHGWSATGSYPASTAGLVPGSLVWGHDRRFSRTRFREHKGRVCGTSMRVAETMSAGHAEAG